MYVTECAKWGAVPDDELVKEAGRVVTLARVVTLEGHYARVLSTKKKADERTQGIAKYALRYAIVPPDSVHPLLKAEIDKYQPDKGPKP